MLSTFILTVFAWIFFRSYTIRGAVTYIAGIFSKSLFAAPNLGEPKPIIILSIFIVTLVVIEWLGREEQFGIAGVMRLPKIYRWVVYYSLALAIFIFAGLNQAFIYFQF